MLSKQVLGLPASSLPSLGRFRWLICILLLCGSVGSAAGQPYKSDPVDKASRAYGANEKQWLTNPAAFAADKAHFDDFFIKYYFPDMTQANDADLGRLGEQRYKLFKKYLWATTNTQLQQDLTTLAFRELGKRISNPEYHPAFRYNAILVIGMLDEQYANASGQAPKPLPQATKALTAVVDSATDPKNTHFPPPIILGAIIGLERHAQLRASLAPEAVAAMTAALVKLVLHDAPIQEMDLETYAWMRVRAAAVLAKLGNVGEKNSVHNALIKLIASTKSLDDRCEAAGLLDKITYKDVKLDDATTAESLFALARDVATAEDKRAADFQNQFSGGSVSSPGPRSRGPEGLGPGSGEEQQETYPRRQVLARLTKLQEGITRVKPALPAETQKKADDVLKAVNAARMATSDKKTNELKLAAAIRTMAAAINKTVPAPAAAKAPPAKAAAAL
jgi:hypothetical protein